MDCNCSSRQHSLQHQQPSRQIYANSCPQLSHFHHQYKSNHKDLTSAMQTPINCQCSTHINSWNKVCLPWQHCPTRNRVLDNIVNLSSDKYLCKNCCFNDQPVVWWVSCPRLSASQPALSTFHEKMNGNLCEYHHQQQHNHQLPQPQKQYKRNSTVTPGNHNSRSITNLGNTSTSYLNYNQCNCHPAPAPPPPPLQSILGHSNNNRGMVHCCVHHSNGGALNENDTSGSGEYPFHIISFCGRMNLNVFYASWFILN